MDVAVLDDPGAARTALEPLRARLLALLAERPASAAALAPTVGLTRQKVRYHLTALARHGLITEVGQQRHGGLTERVFAASADAYVVSPAALGPAGADPSRVSDHLSGAYLVALAARAVREVGAMLGRAAAAGQPLATLSLDTEIRFRSAAERARFTTDLSEAVLELVARYHDDTAPRGRLHRLIVLAHPTPQEEPA